MVALRAQGKAAEISHEGVSKVLRAATAQKVAA